MIEFKGLEQLNIRGKTAVTVGKFDGIHRGHDLLLDRINELKAEGCSSCVVTFTSSPRVVLENPEARSLITNDERNMILEHRGVDYIVECEFTDELMHMEPEDFINLLIRKLHMGYLVVGDDFTFGYRGRGNAAMLRKMAPKLGFKVEIFEKLVEDHGNRDISSTYIRQEISCGHIEKANELLGYDYFIWGEIVHGRHIGHKLGIPTINIVPPDDKLLPPYGVYATIVEIDGEVYHGMTNVGVKPTIQGTNLPGVETHILDFSGDIYGHKARIIFLTYLRREKKFGSLDELKTQLMSDRQKTIDFFNRRTVDKD